MTSLDAETDFKLFFILLIFENQTAT